MTTRQDAGADPRDSAPRPTGEANGPARGGLARDPLSLRIQVEALLLDPRGHFRPRPLTLQPASGGREQALLVMQVGEHEDGSLSVVTSEPLVPGELFSVRAAPTRSPTDPLADAGWYLLCSCRPGNRPEDERQDCWISVLRPQPAAPGRHGA